MPELTKDGGSNPSGKKLETNDPHLDLAYNNSRPLNDVLTNKRYERAVPIVQEFVNLINEVYLPNAVKNNFPKGVDIRVAEGAMVNFMDGALPIMGVVLHDIEDPDKGIFVIGSFFPKIESKTT